MARRSDPGTIMEHIKNQRSTNKENPIFKIPPMEFRDKDQQIQKLLEVQQALIEELERASARLQNSWPEGLASNLAIIATNAWKARTKMMDGESGEPREEMRRVYRHIETMFDAFQQIGLQIKDHTGDSVDLWIALTGHHNPPTTRHP